jgi:membrane dipeptidase
MEPSFQTPAVVDGHVDILYRMMNGDKELHFHELSEGPVTPDKLKAGKIRVFIAALYCPDDRNGPNSALTYLERLLALSETHLTRLQHIRTLKELDDSYRFGADTGFLLLLENADALIECRLERLNECGLRVVGLTHIGRNRIGDGNGVANPEHLTNEGKKLLKKLDAGGFAIDVAHLSDPCFWDVMSRFHGPKISSHTGFRFFCNKPRNLEEDQLKALFEAGGMVGIAADPEMLSMDNTASINDVFKHIDWVVQKYGPRHVGLGSDYCGFGRINRGLEDISKLLDLTKHFDARGYPAEAVSQILGGNWHQFYSSLLRP